MHFARFFEVVAVQLENGDAARGRTGAVPYPALAKGAPPESVCD